MEKISNFEKDPIKRQANEIVNLIYKRSSIAKEYEDVVYTLIKKIIESDCRLRLDAREINENGKKPRTAYCSLSRTIILVVKIDERHSSKFQNDGRSFIYALLHEFGHRLDPDTRRYTCWQKLSRERRAWCYARKEFNKLKAAYSFLVNDYRDFLEYWSFCIGKYKDDYEKCKKKETEPSCADASR